ncbi:hypothetical protein KP806_06630 [Paenibacillus sp. N4]|uniref:permease prefix domain 1-containing protein n=1 Tax=Paenibacillus vietnamensis TaxID=2590547 RepID=UPI001CD08D7D|nr:permease prefix domain 1-containing protein [Paenibacillus vietnamensis]MCA0754721.1 hypothetical protein [Paenibacillus vietnamensis]
MDNVPEFKAYLRSVIDGLGLDADSGEELFQEWYQHLEELLNKYLQDGFNRQEAIKQALRQFGAAEQIRAEWKKSSPGRKAMLGLKETTVWLLCALASSVGPWLFIQATFSLFYLAVTLPVLLICGAVYHILLSRLTVRPPWWLLFVTLGIYGLFLLKSVSLTSLESVFLQLIMLDFSGDGLFTMSGIHLLWAAAVVCRINASPPGQAWKRAIRSSFEFWAMNTAALFLAATELLAGSAEGKVLFLNLVLLYATIQQVIQPHYLIMARSKLKYWFRKALSPDRSL